MSNPQIHAFIQARLSSSRLKGKVLKKISSKSIIELIHSRLNNSKFLDDIIFLIPKNKSSFQLKNFLKKKKFNFFAGSENNVLSRYHMAMRENKSDIILRITADCPLIDHHIVDKMIKEFLKKDYDYFSNTYLTSFPDGFDIEIFSSKCLKKLFKSVKSSFDKEHVTSYIKNNKRKFNCGYFASSNDYSDFRLTIDYEKDLKRIREIYRKNIRNTSSIKILKSLKSGQSPQNDNRNIHIENKNKYLWKKALKIIPTGNQFKSKNPRTFDEENWPAYFNKSKGVNIWDLNNRKFLDMSTMSVGTNVLGYSDNFVDNEVKKIISKGTMSSLNCPEEVYLAEKMLLIHSWGDMVRFARTGSEANCIALRASRSFNRRDKVVICGYHGWHDWYLAANLKNKDSLNNHLYKIENLNGITNNLKNNIFSFEYNNITQLEKIIRENKNKISALIMEVKRDQNPRKDFLKKVRNLTLKNNIVLIFDECTSAFRENFGGIHLKYNIIPDLAMFGKALGNGYPITAIVGKSKIMRELSDSFVSSTFWSDRVGPVAALATLNKMEKIQSWKILDDLSSYMRKCMNQITKSEFMNFNNEGIKPNLSFSFKNRIYEKLFINLMLSSNILSSSRCYLSIKHTKKHIDQFIDNIEYINKEFKKLNLQKI